MLDQLEHLRFLRRAAHEGLISEAEYARHKQRLLVLGTPDENVAAAEVRGRSMHLPAADAEEKRIWQELVGAILELVQCHTAKCRGGPPAVKSPQTQQHQHEKPVQRKRQVTISPAHRRPGSGVRPPPIRPGAVDAMHARSIHDRCGAHTLKHAGLPDLDPLDIDLGELWQDESEPPSSAVVSEAANNAIRRAEETSAASAGPGGRNLRKPIAASRYLQKQQQKRCGERPAPPPSRPAMNRFARPDPPARSSSPATVRRAAAYVAHAAGLKPAPPPPPSHPRIVRLSLHVEVAL